MRIQHDILYVGLRMHACGATRVVLDHVRGLRARGIDAHLVCVGMFARSWAEASCYTEVAGFSGLVLRARAIVVTSALASLLLAKAEYACDVSFFFMQGEEHRYAPAGDARLQRWIEEGIAASGPNWLVPSAGLAEYAWTAYRRRARIVWPFVDRSHFYPRTAPAPGVVGERLRVLLVGALGYAVKGLRHAYEAIAAFARDRISVVRLSRAPLAAGESCDELHLDPPLQRIGAIYRSCDVLMYPSLSEGFGLPVLEAMSCGTTVITTPCRGMRGWVHAGRNALVVAPGTAEALRAGLQELLDAPLRRAELARAGVETAALFDERRTVDRLLEVYSA